MVISLNLLPLPPLWQTASTEATRLPYGGMPEFQSRGEEAFIRQEEASGVDGTILYKSYLERSP